MYPGYVTLFDVAVPAGSEGLKTLVRQEAAFWNIDQGMDACRHERGCVAFTSSGELKGFAYGNSHTHFRTSVWPTQSVADIHGSMALVMTGYSGKVVDGPSEAGVIVETRCVNACTESKNFQCDMVEWTRTGLCTLKRWAADGEGALCADGKTGPATAGTLCVFPFTYMGSVNTRCIGYDKPWCATQATWDQNHWGGCSACPPGQSGEKLIFMADALN